MNGKIDFLEETPGQKSSSRLMSVMALVAGIGIEVLSMHSGAPSDMPEWLVSLAFLGKVGSKMVEGSQHKEKE